jgi:hypothetical protein
LPANVSNAGRGERGAVQEVHTEREHAEQRDHNRCAGEENRAAGRVHCKLERGLDVATVLAKGVAISRDDEEGVVDADAEPDHQRQLGGEVDHVDEVDWACLIAWPPSSTCRIGERAAFAVSITRSTAVKEALGRALASRPQGKDALEAVRDFILSSHAVEKSDLDEGLHRIIRDDETLRSHLRARLAQLEELVAAAIAEDLGAAEDDLRPQVVAASLTAAFDVLFEQGGDQSVKPKSVDEVAALIDPVMTFLRGGLDALK